MTISHDVSGLSIDDLLMHSVDGIFAIDRNRRCVVFSRACERITGFDRSSVVDDELCGHGHADRRDDHGRSLAGILCPNMLLFDGELPFFIQRMSLRHRNGHLVWIETSYSPIRNSNGEVVRVIGIMREVPEKPERSLEGLEPTDRSAEECTTPDADDRFEGATESGSDETAPKGGSLLDQMLSIVERREIVGALQRAKGQRTKAAHLLGVSRSRLYRRMDSLGIDPRQVKAGAH